MGAGRLQSGRFHWDAGHAPSVMAAVILGGTSLFGCARASADALFGPLMVGQVNTGQTLFGLEVSRIPVLGLITVLAAFLAGCT